MVMKATTSEKTTQVLRGLFSHYDVPAVLASDNGPHFTSVEFFNFLISNGVKYVRSAPFHLAPNGLAERCVQTFKHYLNSSRGISTVQKRLDAFLLQYRNTPHIATNGTQAILFLH